MNQLPLQVQLRASSVFATFYSGPNDAIVRQLMDLQPFARAPAIWLQGLRGAGKTHLLQAVCAKAGEQGLPAGYFPLSDNALRPDALIGCENLSFVCLDDVERIVGQHEWERAMFRLYTELEDVGGRLLLASVSSPSSLPIALKDLASRLAAGMVLRIQPLSDDDQIATLMLRAKILGLELPTEVAQFLIHRLPRDMASLCSALDALDRASLASQRRLTVPFVRSVLEAKSNYSALDDVTRK